LITQVFLQGDKWIYSDVVGAVKVVAHRGHGTACGCGGD
jgi:hypothetical protein